MIYDITKLNNSIDKCIDINEKYSFSKEELDGTDLLKLDNIEVSGQIIKNSLGNIELNANINGIMVLPCAVTLNPVNYPFNIDINQEISNSTDENLKNVKNTIDILPIIWENILLEIPLRVVSDEAKDITLKGNGWIFTTEEVEKNNPFMDLLNDDTNSEVK